MRKPRTSEHDGILVVRDDLYPGGTKARFIPALFEGADEIVYATPCEGGAQTALATVAAALGKRATLFCAERSEQHSRVRMGMSLGAKYHFVTPGYLTVVQARAREYCAKTGAKLALFGMPGAVGAIAGAARSLKIKPREVWCAAGSGTLARGLAEAWPDARRFAVQVGRELTPEDVAGATIVRQPLPFGKPHKGTVPFPSDPHYDAKAYAACVHGQGKGLVLFWNVTGAATTEGSK